MAIARAPVIVVGAGLAGLAAALALARFGFPVRLLERAGRLEEVGAGLQLSPNVLRVLDRLGVLPELKQQAVEARHAWLRDMRSGRTLARVPIEGRDGTPYLSIRRADLQDALAKAVADHATIDFRLGHELVDIAREGSDWHLTLTGDGRRQTLAADTVIAADGVRSAIAARLGLAAPMRSGNAAWRLMLDAPAGLPPGVHAWLGPRAHLVAYPVSGGRATNLVLVLPDAVERPETLVRTEDPSLRGLLDRSGSATKWPLLTVDRRRPPDDDAAGLLLIGDAAHAMEPYAAQGAALAIEDGFVAARCLADAGGDAALAWRRFEDTRRPRWDRVRRRVAFHRRIYHMPPPLSWVRNLAMAAKTEAALAAELRWLYDWMPPGD